MRQTDRNMVSLARGSAEYKVSLSELTSAYQTVYERNVIQNFFIHTENTYVRAHTYTSMYLYMRLFKRIILINNIN